MGRQKNTNTQKAFIDVLEGMETRKAAEIHNVKLNTLQMAFKRIGGIKLARDIYNHEKQLKTQRQIYKKRNEKRLQKVREYNHYEVYE